jgi:hypothetical protein
MVKDKYVWLVALFVVLYVGWVAVSGFLTHATTFSWSVHDQKVARMQVVGDIDGLIVGGSNAVYSLSAERMSELSGGSWFNASLPAEGFSMDNQTAFLDDVVNSVDAEMVKTVIISSVKHWRFGHIDDFTKGGLGFDGVKATPFWLPHQPLWKLNDQGSAKIFPNLIAGRGDLIHEATDLCVGARPGVQPKWASNREIDVMLQSWLPVIHSRFPQAAIVVTIPSRYLREVPDPIPARDYVGRLQSRINAWISAHPESLGVQIYTNFEPVYTDPTIVCGRGPHFNAEGRALRTEALYKSMIEKGVLDGR